MTAVSPDPSGITEEEDAARRLAMARQWIAHKGTGYIPPWEGLTPVEQEQAETEARHWINAAVNAGVTIVPAGRTVVDHREPDQRYDGSAVWCVGPFDLVARGDETIHFTWHSNIPPRQTMGVHTVRALAASLLAALAENERLAVESPVTAGGVE